MYKVMFVDTETTGLFPKGAEYNDVTLSDGTWPFVTQIAFKIYEVDESSLQFDKELVDYSAYIKPTYDKSLYSAEAQEKTGLSYEYLQDCGIVKEGPLTLFIHWLKNVDFVVSHNTYFDMKVLKAELFRIGIDQHLRIVPWVDTVYHGGELFKKFGTVKRYPKLADLYERIYDSAPSVQLHSATSDVSVLVDCFRGLISQGILTPERIKLRIENHISTADA